MIFFETAWKVHIYGIFSGQYFPFFSPNTDQKILRIFLDVIPACIIASIFFLTILYMFISNIWYYEFLLPDSDDTVLNPGLTPKSCKTWHFTIRTWMDISSHNLMKKLPFDHSRIRCYILIWNAYYLIHATVSRKADHRGLQSY